MQRPSQDAASRSIPATAGDSTLKGWNRPHRAGCRPSTRSPAASPPSKRHQEALPCTSPDALCCNPPDCHPTETWTCRRDVRASMRRNPADLCPRNLHVWTQPSSEARRPPRCWCDPHTRPRRAPRLPWDPRPRQPRALGHRVAHKTDIAQCASGRPANRPWRGQRSLYSVRHYCASRNCIKCVQCVFTPHNQLTSSISNAARGTA